MKYRWLVLFGVLATVVAVGWVPIAGQAPRTAASTAAPTYTPPKTAWGDPDLQGLWRSLHRVDFERSPKYAGREFLTDAEVAELERRAEAQNADRLAGKLENRGFRSQPNYNSIVGYSADRARYSKRTSAIIDPPDGHLPPWTLEQVALYEQREEWTVGRGEADSWVDRPPGERCIEVLDFVAPGYWGMSLSGQTGFLSSVRAVAEKGGSGGGLGGGGSAAIARPEALNGGEEFTNAGSAGGPARFVQAPGYVAITREDGNDYSIIPLDGHPHLSAKFRQWKGDVRGHWEGNTLVVETTNLKFPYPIIMTYGNNQYPGDALTLRITQRYTRTGPDTIEYKYTVEDPKVYVRPYTVLYELTRDDNYKVTAPICHEGHDDMPSALASGRVDEETALENANDSKASRAPRLQQLKEEAIKAAEQMKKR